MDNTTTLNTYDRLIASNRTPPPQQLTSGHFRTRFGYRVVRQQGAGSWLLFFTTHGKGYFQQPGAQLTATAGDITLLAPKAYSDYGVPSPASGKIKIPKTKNHERYIQFLHLNQQTSSSPARNGWQFHWIHFQAKKTWTRFLKLSEVGTGLRHCHISHRQTHERLVSAFQQLHADRIQGDNLSQQLALNSLEEILLLIGRDRGDAIRPLDQRIQNVLETINGNLAAKHTVRSLAKVATLSPSRFAHLFKQETGDSVTQMILKLRIRQSQEMLRATQERIAHVAYALGFECPFYFSRQFRALVGQSPSEYRKSARELNR